MTTFTFQGQTFQMESPAKFFLEKYLKRIETYAKKHQISPDMVDDLQQNIGEKLFTLKQPITQKKLIPLINTLGEPEAIFEEENSIPPLEKEEKGGIGVRFFRALGKVFKVGFGGFFMGIWLLIKWIAIGIRQGCKWLSIGLRFFLKYLGIGLLKFFSIGSRVVGMLIFFCISIGLIAVLGVRFGDLTVLNQSFKLLVPNMIVWGLIGMLVCCGFWMTALASSFSATPLKNWYLHLVIGIVFFGSCIVNIASLTPLTQIRSFTHSQEVKLILPITDETPIQLHLPHTIEAGMQDWRLNARTFTSTGEEIKLVIKSKFRTTNAAQAQQIISAIVQPQLIELSEATYELVRPEGQIFNHIVPFNAIELVADVYAPIGNVELIR